MGFSVAGCADQDAPAGPAGSDQAHVTRVIDGDTFDARLPGGDLARIRIPQIDAPERDECGFDEATVRLEELVLDLPVELSPTESGPDHDPHGRLLRSVRVDGNDVGEIVIREGLARWVPRYADEDPALAETYADAERLARDQAAGSWSTCRW